MKYAWVIPALLALRVVWRVWLRRRRDDRTMSVGWSIERKKRHYDGEYER